MRKILFSQMKTRISISTADNVWSLLQRLPEMIYQLVRCLKLKYIIRLYNRIGTKITLEKDRILGKNEAKNTPNMF